MRSKKRDSPPGRLGPSGPQVRIGYWNHGADMVRERLLDRYGVSRREVEQGIRFANARRADEKDPHREGDRFRRWFVIRTRGEPIEVRVVFKVVDPETASDPGEIEVITVVVENDQPG